MPNKQIHLGVAVVILCIYGLILYKFSSLEYIFFGVSIFAGAVLPDVLNPWTKENRYNHRGFAHSKRLLKPLVIVSLISLIFSFFVPAIALILMFSLGYLSHLSLDAIKTTSWSKGLPD